MSNTELIDELDNNEYSSDFDNDLESQQGGDIEDLDIVESEDDIDTSKVIIVANKDRITRPYMTKYELVRIIGTRRKQLSLGAKPMIKVEGDLTINEIVDAEIRNKMIPFKIKRPLPDSNKIEIWNFDELEFNHLI